MKNNNSKRGNRHSREDDQFNDDINKSMDDGRSKEWQDRGRVALDRDIDPDAKTNVERDVEPENLRKEKSDDKVY
jgi:hypothetical protein